MGAGTEVTAVFAGDLGPLEKTAAQLRVAMKATQANVAKDLTFTPKIDDTAMKASLANIQVQLKQWQQGAFSKMVVPPPRDFAASNAYLDGVYSRVPDPTTSALRRGGMPSSGGGGGRLQVGMAAMQVQDIAVQLQSGTRWATIMAQQGSQLASFFGPTGMVVGGAIAIGAAYVGAGQSANAAFTEMIKGAKETHKAIQPLIAGGSVTEVAQAYESIGKSLADIDQARKTASSIGGIIMGGAGMLTGGPSYAEKLGGLEEARRQQSWDKEALRYRMLESSNEEVDLAQLRAKGEDRQIEKLEAQIRLKRRLAEIDNLSLSQEDKDYLKNNERQIAAALKVRTEVDKTAEGYNLIRERLREIEDAKLMSSSKDGKSVMLQELQENRRNRALMNGGTMEESDVRARASTMASQGDFKGADEALKALKEYQATERQIIDLNAEMRQSGAEEAKANWQKQERVRLVKEEWAIEQQISNAIARSGRRDTPEVKALEDKAKTQRLKEQFVGQGMNAQEAQAKAETTVKNDNAAQEAVKRREQAQSLGEMQVTAAINNARAHGHIGQADRMESKAAEDRKTKDLVELGVPEAEARKQARAMQRDEDKLSGRGGRIKGGKSSNEWGLDKARTPALDAWKERANVPIKAQTPALDAMMKRQANANAKAAGKANSGATNTETLLEALLKSSTAIEQKLNIAK